MKEFFNKKKWQLLLSMVLLAMPSALLVFNFLFSIRLLIHNFPTQQNPEYVKISREKLENIIEKIIQENKNTGDPKKIDPKLRKQLIYLVTGLLETSWPYLLFPEKLAEQMVGEFLKGIANKTGEYALDLAIKIFGEIFFPPPKPTICPTICPSSSTPAIPGLW